MFKFLFAKKEKNLSDSQKTNNEVSKTESSEKVSIENVKAEGISEKKIVAIATAAIAASRGESDCAFDVLSITKIS